MAFKMKGMSFGKGTQYKSPQKMKAEAAMKMQREAAMKMAKNSAMDMAKDPMKMKKGSAMDMAEKSPMKINPLLPVAKKAVQKGVKELAKNKKVQQKVIKPVTRKLAPVIKKAKGTKVGKFLDKANKTVKAKKQSLLDKGKQKATEFLKKYGPDIGITAVALGAGASAAKPSKKDKPAVQNKKQDNKNIKVNKNVSVVTSGPDTGKVVKTKPKVDKFAEAKKRDPNLSKYVAERKKHKKGSPEYNALQNKINKAYGVSKRHGQTTTTKTAGPKVSKDTKRTTKTKVATPGLGSKQTKVVKGTKDNIRKTKVVERTESGDVSKKTKQKFDVKGNRKKKKVTTKSNDTVTKLKINDRKNEPAKIKTRKRGGTGIGSAIKGALAERKIRRAKRKANR
tara:strand:+ start:470 stop:1651 length:1182 start_codon:yes stop_codon:yes gene_type:complete